MASPPDTVTIAAAGLDAAAAYKLMTGAITPRPIAWVSTLGPEGIVNLAPFSSYVFLAYDPPLLGLSIGPCTGRLKDTLRNIEESGAFTVNSVATGQIEAMAASSRRYPPGIGEADDLAVPLAPGTEIAVPRIAASDVALECRLERTIELGDRDRHRLIVGRVVTFVVAARVFNGDRIDPALFRPVGRLGGLLYVTTTDIVRVEPKPDPRMLP